MKNKVTYVTGCAPNIPWWRLRTMTDDEIKAFNDRFLRYETKEFDDVPPMNLTDIADARAKDSKLNYPDQASTK